MRGRISPSGGSPCGTGAPLPLSAFPGGFAGPDPPVLPDDNVEDLEGDDHHPGDEEVLFAGDGAAEDEAEADEVDEAGEGPPEAAQGPLCGPGRGRGDARGGEDNDEEEDDDAGLGEEGGAGRGGREVDEDDGHREDGMHHPEEGRGARGPPVPLDDPPEGIPFPQGTVSLLPEDRDGEDEEEGEDGEGVDLEEGDDLLALVHEGQGLIGEEEGGEEDDPEDPLEGDDMGHPLQVLAEGRGFRGRGHGYSHHSRDETSREAHWLVTYIIISML